MRTDVIGERFASKFFSKADENIMPADRVGINELLNELILQIFYLSSWQ